MNILVVLAILVVFALLRFRRANLFAWAIAWWVGCYVLFRFGFAAPIPASVISIYMGIVSLAILAFVSSSEERREEVSRPLVRLMTEKRYTPLLVATVVAIPALAAANVYVQMNVPIEPPFFPRTVHPASPPEITVHDKKIAIETGDNPFRELETSNPEEFRKHVENGRRVYYQNCVFCHGDNMAGNGMFVHGLDPIPTNFADGDRSQIFERRFSSGEPPREAPGCRKKAAPGTRPCRPGKDPEGRRDLGRRPLSLRLHRREASRPGGARAMTSRAPILAVALVCAACRCSSLAVCRDDGPTMETQLRAQGPDIGTEAQRESGKTLYLKNCSQCHGDKGDGEGYATPHLYPRPRNFTSGKFKVRTTPNGALPTHQDLVNIIRRGMPYTSMPAWPNLSDRKCRISPTSSRPSLPTSRTPRVSPSPWSSRARRPPRTSPSSSGRSSTRRPAA